MPPASTRWPATSSPTPRPPRPRPGCRTSRPTTPDLSTTGNRFTVTGRLLESRATAPGASGSAWTTSPRTTAAPRSRPSSGCPAGRRRGHRVGPAQWLPARLPDHRARASPVSTARPRALLPLRPPPLPRAAQHHRRRRPVPDRSGLAARRTCHRAGGRPLPARSVDPDRRVLANRPDGLELEPLPDSYLPLTLEAASAPTPVLVAGAAAKPPLDVSGDDRVLGARPRARGAAAARHRRPAHRPAHEHGRLRLRPCPARRPRSWWPPTPPTRCSPH